MKPSAHITKFSGTDEVNFESLPVNKITDYPLETGSYKPYAQAILSLTSTHYILRMLAFEAITAPESLLIAAWYPFQDDPHKQITVRRVPSGSELFTAWVVEGTQQGSILPVELHPLKGEDLQGIYWGWDVWIPLAEVTRYGAVYQSPGDRFPGNFYKIQETVPTHYGSFAPVDFAGGNWFSPENMGEFVITAY